MRDEEDEVVVVVPARCCTTLFLDTSRTRSAAAHGRDRAHDLAALESDLIIVVDHLLVDAPRTPLEDARKVVVTRVHLVDEVLAQARQRQGRGRVGEADDLRGRLGGERGADGGEVEERDL